mgnify:CR=1 FL=1
MDIKLKIFSTIFFSSMVLVGCYDCEQIAADYRSDECLLIVKSIPDIKENFFNFKGLNPLTGKECNCRTKTSSRWWSLYKDRIEIGDTIIKRKGNLFLISIKRIQY